MGFAVRLALLLSLMMIAPVAVAQVQVTTKVVAGQEATLLESKQKLELRSQPKKGAARIEMTGQGDAQLSRLIYRAQNTSENTTDDLTYAVDNGQAQTLRIEIASEALTFAGGAYSEGFKALFVMFVLAVVLESALAVVFNWRPFVESLNARAVRPLISFGAALVFVQSFSLDLVTSLVNAATTLNHQPTLLGKVLTALVLAGGSAGIYNMLVTLGYRQRRTPETVAPKPPPDKAWISIKIDRQEAVSPIEVFMGLPVANGTPPLVSVVSGSSRPGIQYFLADRGRFPTYGGHAVPAGTELSIHLQGKDRNQQPVLKTWGPHTVAGGAFIDLRFTL